MKHVLNFVDINFAVPKLSIFKASSGNHYIIMVCVDFLFYVPVNSHGHVGTVNLPNPTIPKQAYR